MVGGGNVVEEINLKFLWTNFKTNKHREVPAWGATVTRLLCPVAGQYFCVGDNPSRIFLAIRFRSTVGVSNCVL